MISKKCFLISVYFIKKTDRSTQNCTSLKLYIWKMDFTFIKNTSQGSLIYAENDGWQTFILTENNRHLPTAGVNKPLFGI